MCKEQSLLVEGKLGRHVAWRAEVRGILFDRLFSLKSAMSSSTKNQGGVGEVGGLHIEDDV